MAYATALHVSAQCIWNDVSAGSRQRRLKPLRMVSVAASNPPTEKTLHQWTMVVSIPLSSASTYMKNVQHTVIAVARKAMEVRKRSFSSLPSSQPDQSRGREITKSTPCERVGGRAIRG